ncbi:MAG: HAD family hydrolase [Saccharofermentans sp.]|nr:HAD family hydrolase [Saccharofermentans sp.]
MYKHVLFDLDGTLTDPGLGITNSIMHALRHFGMEVPAREELYQFIGPPLYETFIDYYGFSEEKADEGVRVFRENYQVNGLFENEVYDGIPQTLSELKKRGCKIHLATSKPEPFAIRILEHFDLIKYFDFVAGSTMNTNLGADGGRTTKAEVIRHVLTSNNITDTSEVIMVGDRRHDVEGAAEHNIKTIGVLFGYGSRGELESSGAAYVVERPQEILNYI